jgi:hypothetical protein
MRFGLLRSRCGRRVGLGGGADDQRARRSGSVAGGVGGDVVDGVGRHSARVDDDVADELAVEECADAEVEAWFDGWVRMVPRSHYCSEQGPDARGHSHSQCAPERDPHCANGHTRAARARSQRTQKREEQK